MCRCSGGVADRGGKVDVEGLVRDVRVERSVLLDGLFCGSYDFIVVPLFDGVPEIAFVGIWCS